MIPIKEFFIQIKNNTNAAFKHFLYVLYAITFTFLTSINIGTLTMELKLNFIYTYLTISAIFLILAFKYITSPLKLSLIFSSIMMTMETLKNINFFNRIDNIIYLLLIYIFIYIIYELIIKRKNISTYNKHNSLITTILSLIFKMILHLILTIFIIGLASLLIFLTINILHQYNIPSKSIYFVSFIIMLFLLISMAYIRSNIIKSIIILTILGLYIIFIAHGPAFSNFPINEIPHSNIPVIIGSRIFSWFYLLIITYFTHKEKQI